MPTMNSTLTKQLESLIDPNLPFESQMLLLRTSVDSYFGSNTTALWSYLEYELPLRDTPFALGIGFETVPKINSWLLEHPYPWQAVLELLRHPTQDWSHDRKHTHAAITKLVEAGVPSAPVEQNAMVNAVYSLLTFPVWRPACLRAFQKLALTSPPVFWRLPNLTRLDITNYKASPLLLMFGANLSFAASTDVSPVILNVLTDYWKELELNSYSKDRNVCPAVLGYVVLSEALGWSDESWLTITGSKRDADFTWRLVDKLAPAHLNTWKDLLDGDSYPHRTLSVYMKKSLGRLPVNSDLPQVESVLHDLEFTVPFDSF